MYVFDDDVDGKLLCNKQNHILFIYLGSVFTDLFDF